MSKLKTVICICLVICAVLPLCACGGADIVPVGSLDATVTGSGSNEDFQYNIYSDGTVGITKYTGGYTRHTVPSEIDGMQVSRIEEKAYFDCNLVKVTIPDSVIWIGNSAFELNRELVTVNMSNNCLHIGEKAFYNCQVLKNVVVPDCLEYIGAYAFTLTEWINSHEEDFVIVGQGILIKYLGHDREVTVPDNVRFISTAFATLNGRVDGIRSRLEKVVIGPNVEIIGDHAFSLCGFLADVNIPESITYIGKYAFADCVRLEKLEIPKTITRIEEGTFMGCEGFKEYTVPDHIEYIGAKAFAECLNLETLNIGSGVEYIDRTVVEASDWLSELNVSEENEVYSALDLCLYSKDMSELYYYHRYKADTYVEIPDSVKIIHKYAFMGAENIVELYLPENLEKISIGAFENCTSIEYLHVYDKLTKIESGAFLTCSQFTEVFYYGSKEQWEQIEVDQNNNSLLLSYINFDFTGEE